MIHKHHHGTQVGGVRTFEELGDGLAEQQQVVVLVVLGLEVDHLALRGREEGADVSYIGDLEVYVHNLQASLGCRHHCNVLRRECGEISGCCS